MTDMPLPKLITFYILLLFATACQAKEYDLAILGDSISSGYGVPADDNWVSLIKPKLNCSSKIQNLSIQGATSSDGITQLENFYKKHRSRYLLVELGGNDALRGQSLTQLYRNLNEIITMAQEHDSRVLLIGIDLPPNYGGFFRQRLQTTYAHVAQIHNIEMVQLDFPNNPDLMQDDALHPNPLGHQNIAQAVLPMINTAMCSAE
ncbi:GDSL-type esterase/lipase family protein [Candidatus Synchoanobacter obligatus]|uniref:GDSL-type esterase/lipase family protein n=1 Tax=Candidatus Synchoanobacter obligatus TaxID=2919597 RepID=A0ABT1L3K2_9GAMM|nr:GDSL-type esterase/lipase family protein [Candidatus Synchoanobacter obligatus]MCP8351802.1 GDSL-type esterase/lipase family protein [Candidatus Synchoanobacter obligatus]